MKVNREKFKEDYNLRAFGAKGWMNSKSLSCPFCGKGGDKFGVSLGETNGAYHCMRCNAKGNIFQLLRKLGRNDLILGENFEFTFRDELEGVLKDFQVKEEDITCSDIDLPIGFKSIDYDSYLEKRGFESWQYSQYKVGLSLNPKLQGKVIFILTEDNRCIAYLGRSRHTKDWHKENLEKYKERLCPLVTRYENSEGTQFEKIVGGIDEIIEGETKTVILVEGIMDKANTDKILELQKTTETKCCFTFGCKLSDIQMIKLYQRGIQNIILLYDPGTIQQVKSTSLRLQKYFNIFIGELVGEKDPGDMNIFDFEKVFLSLKNPIEYYVNRIQNIKLSF